MNLWFNNFCSLIGTLKPFGDVDKPFCYTFSCETGLSPVLSCTFPQNLNKSTYPSSTQFQMLIYHYFNGKSIEHVCISFS